tara:strand:+ start:4281 stop:4595 length:315 start_codon:yes stop_codon:yes gene_type:complete
MKTTYKPLPDNLTIRKSKIEGLGLFANKKISKGTILGTTHWKKEGELNDLIRTPLGGFINHSEVSNCQLLDIGTHLVLECTKDIKRGEELTLTYQFYSLNGEEE